NQLQLAIYLYIINTSIQRLTIFLISWDKVNKYTQNLLVLQSVIYGLQEFYLQSICNEIIAINYCLNIIIEVKISKNTFFVK
ncbi:hypothetical protein CEN42_13430, partial [Fischerella thermalis CCMEE 5208]